MRFLHPEYGFFVAAVVPAAFLLKWLVRRRYVAVTASVRLRSRRFRASVLRRLPFVALAASMLLTAAAAAEPVIPYSQTDVHSRGLDIVILLDLSSSMQEDMDSAAAATRPAGALVPLGRTRLDAVKNAVKIFIRARREDRIGLVVFSDNAYVVSPLTFDHEYLLHYVDLVDDKLLEGEGQTAIGDGLALADYVLARQGTAASRGHQVVVLFTDGESNRGRDPVDVLKEAHNADIRVHIVGVDIEREVREKPAVQLLLRGIERNGGRYFNAQSERQLDDASRTIDHIEKGTLVSKPYVRDVPVYEWFALPALVALFVALAFGAIPYFTDVT